VCTLGPATDTIEVLKDLVLNGLDVARFNFSHGSHSDHAQRMNKVRSAAAETGKAVAILLDTQGPEIRLGTIKGGTVNLQQGDAFVLRTTQEEGDAAGASVSYPYLPEDVYPGAAIWIGDGLIGLKVERVEGSEVFCTVTNGGELSSRKGVNLPGIPVRLPSITSKDVDDINFGIEQGVDFIAASFVRRASDVLEIRKLLEAKGANIHIIAKIESRQGVENIDEILQVADGIMVARGDLGVEIPTEEVPLVQKAIIEKCNRQGKPVITATQMLDSMIRNPRPTRAEASDVANAIFDGTDAIMLSGETANGKYPVEAVKTMSRIALRVEQALNFEEMLRNRCVHCSTPDAVSHATSSLAWDLEAAAIITATKSGSTAKMVSKYRPKAPIIAATPDEAVLRKLRLVWGVNPLLIEETQGTDELVAEAVAKALAAEYIKSGDLVVVTAGVPVGVPGSTNLVKVQIVGEVVGRGTGIGAMIATGTVRVVLSGEEALKKVQLGDILVTNGTEKEFVPAMGKAAGVITEVGGLTSHAAIVCLNLGIPVIVGVPDATKLPDGEVVTLDGRRGLVYQGVVKVL